MRLSLWYPQWAWLFLTGYLVLVVVALVIIGAMAPIRRLSPVMKRITELFDGAVVASIIPLLLWITGVYDMVRNLRF
jgi:hypothetical protein